jgi:ATP-dependent helicase/nuclease subunit A
VLVERFLQLLEENAGWRVPDIVAVTFTEKAAREMVSRIRREIRSRIEQSRSADERRRWREHRNALDSARIGTIHSLCASILRAHPAEAGLDPAFEVIEEIEGAALLEQAIDDALYEAARADSSRDEADKAAEAAEASDAPSDVFTGLELLAHLSPREVRSALGSLVAQGERARSACALLSGLSASETMGFWQRTLDSMRAEAAHSLVERESWRRDADTVRRLAALDAADKREVCRREVARLLLVVNEREGDERVRALVDIASCINLAGGSKKKWASEDDLKAVTEALRRMREAVRGQKLLSLELNEADEIAAEVCRCLVLLYEKARARFAALKQERGAVDFNDLEEITERMLSAHEEVRERYTDTARGLLCALMVDEFQDTSPIQKRILWMIAPRSGELFIIGDAKQSIYRFRGADVTVFSEARREFEESRISNLKVETLNAGLTIKMDRCFRTHERLVNFSNHIFPSIFTRESRYDMSYETMSAARAALHARAPVELHVITQEKESSDPLSIERLREVEAALVARRIEEIIARGDALVCDDKGGGRRAEYGDFALLFQASTNFEIYEQALADARIPYVTIAGRGFYDRQEIIDVTNLLAFLASPLDSLRLAAALRSPMFAVSDETLFRLRLKRRTLWQSLCDESVNLPDDGEREAVQFARETLKRLRSLVGRASAAEIIIAALRETGYLTTLMALPYGERRAANVEKLIEQARALSSMTLSEIVERLASLKFREAREGEATVEETGAVRLMTVHKSKGLEFPIVWIADATYGGGRNNAIVGVHTEIGLAVDIRVYAAEQGDEPRRAGSFEMMRLVEERMDQAEKKRLFYVAATRARDHLIISGATGRAKLADSNWMGRVMRALGLDENERPEAVEYPGGEVSIAWHDGEKLAALLYEGREPSYRHGLVSRQEADFFKSLQSSPDQIDATDASDAFPLIRPIITK